MEKQTYLDDCRKHNTIYFDHECPKCGWNALSENGLEQGYCDIILPQSALQLFDSKTPLHIKCTCPICNEEFEYFDGSP